MKIRAITGFFFVAVMIASLLLGAYVFTLFVLILSVLAMDEFYHLVSSPIIKPQKIMGIVLAISIYLPLYQHLSKGESLQNMLLCVPLVVAIFIVELYRKCQMAFHGIAYTLFGVLFAAAPFYFFYALAFIDGGYNAHYPLGFLVLLWANDTGAYLIGSKWGRHKLFERHSPKKSWEGFWGGILSCLLVSLIISYYFHELSNIHWLIIAFITGLVGTFGDLSESMLKRSLATKDSGYLLPGHGGILDRFDGLLLAAPLVYVYLQLLLR
ncbi:MAG: phosphatidate cytidylyltransferase [Sphingobacteriaceae bacterium]